MKKKIYQQPQTAVVNVNFEGLLTAQYSVGSYSITESGDVTSGLNFLGDGEDDNLSGTVQNGSITNSGSDIIITTKKHNLWDVDW